MTNLYDWGRKWGVSVAAVQDLQREMAMQLPDTYDPETEPRSEAAVTADVRLEAAAKGVLLFRNNVGATYTREGSFLRYGLCNDTHALNERLKSADLIGGRPTLIEPRHVGNVILQFVSRECKPSDWTYTATPREQAQLAWAELILGHGGDAGFCTGRGTL